jgi:hypothetical protein
MERIINSDGMIKEGDDNVMVYYHSKYLFSKLKRRIENEYENNKNACRSSFGKIKIGEPIKKELVVIDLGEVE